MSITAIEVFAGDRRWRADLTRAACLATALDFNGPQPGFFGAPPASSQPLRSGAFVGDVAQGGSCKCATHRLTPHCNGTHTECIGHVVAEAVSIHDVAPRSLQMACLLSVVPATVVGNPHRNDPAAQSGDPWITAAALERAAAGHPLRECSALIVRTQPNPESKRHRQHDAGASLAPYFSSDAMRWIVAQDIEHLVVDVPSIDRAADEGRLAGHRIFWGLPAGSTRLEAASRPRATITELAYVGNELADGLYLLDLQLAPFASDASPSRPLIYPLAPVAP